jgi:adenylate cyclase
VAVLPFANLSQDPAQEYFSDGVTEDLITGLSKVSGLFVIARNSVFTYKGKPVQVREVGRDLGVRYVLEGGVQRSGSRVRITAQLVDASTGYHIWAERYDREVNDIFALQDQVTQQIVRAMAVKLTEGEKGRLGRPPTGVVEAYDLVLRGHEERRLTTPDGNAQARRLFVRALDLDPGYAAAYLGLSWTHLQSWQLLWSTDREVSWRRTAHGPDQGRGAKAAAILDRRIWSRLLEIRFSEHSRRVHAKWSKTPLVTLPSWGFYL